MATAAELYGQLKRAGANWIVTYAAADLARWLGPGGAGLEGLVSVG